MWSSFSSVSGVDPPCQCEDLLTRSADIVVIFPFHIPIFAPRNLSEICHDGLATLRIIPRRQTSFPDDCNRNQSSFVRLNFPINFVTAPLIGDLFLLAILAIGRQEVHDGIIGANNISPIDIMVFFLTLAYIAISIDASGLIRFLAYKVLQKGGKDGHRLFLYLYIFFFGLGSFIGNDPIILSGTPFLAYMTRVSSNIINPRAWIFTQFAVANIASAILVSSNPTNLVIARAFDIKFIIYTANMVVPVVVTAIVLFPFLLYIVFGNGDMIPASIKMHELPDEMKNKKPINPNISHAVQFSDDDQGNLHLIEEIMNPFLDKGGAAFGALIMATTLITVIALNAASRNGGDYPVFWVTLPAAFVTFSWDVVSGWIHRHESRKISRTRHQRSDIQEMEERSRKEIESMQAVSRRDEQGPIAQRVCCFPQESVPRVRLQPECHKRNSNESCGIQDHGNEHGLCENRAPYSPNNPSDSITVCGGCVEVAPNEAEIADCQRQEQRASSTLLSVVIDTRKWFHETFPTVTAVISHLPFALVPFAFAMFVLVQGLVTKGWVQVFAYGWERWLSKTGTIGSIGGMGFVSVILCNVSFFFHFLL